MPHELPPEMISLIHHIELNKAGWRQKVIQRVIGAILWLDGPSMTVAGIVACLHKFGLAIEQDEVEQQVTLLISESTLLRLQDGTVKISEPALAEYERDLKANQLVEQNAKSRFSDCLRQCCPNLEVGATWDRFNRDLLFPLVSEAGARTHELICGHPSDLPEANALRSFLSSYPSEHRQSIRDCITLFWDPRQQPIRQYLLRHLYAQLALNAIGVSPATLAALTGKKTPHPSFAIYVDTNFIFSLLGVHENPSNESAQAFVALARAATAIDVRLYVLPPTVAEARGVLRAKEAELKDLGLTRGLAKAALQTDISGITRRVAQDISDGRFTSPKEQLDIYVQNLIRLLESRGIERNERDLTPYATRQDVVDDIEAQREYEERALPPDRRRPYQALAHDMVLWHFVKDQRPQQLESPADAGSWVVTVDRRLAAFDRRKRGPDSPIPVVLLPATFAQLIQFWVPRTPQLEDTLVSNLRLPLFYQESDPDTERAVVTILRALGRFENIDDVPDDTLTAILVDDALRIRILGAAEADQEAIVREVLDQKYDELSASLAAAHSEIQSISAQLGEREQAIEELTRDIHSAKDESSEKDRELAAIASRIQELEARSREEERDKSDLAARQRFARVWVYLPMTLACIIALAIASMLSSSTSWNFWGIAGAVALPLMPLVLQVAYAHGGSLEPVRRWGAHRTLGRARSGVLAVSALGAVGIAALQSGLVFISASDLISQVLVGVVVAGVVFWITRALRA